MENNNIVSSEKKMPIKREIIIVVLLLIIFVCVLLGAFWDLYGRSLLVNYLCGSQNITSSLNTQATSTASEVPRLQNIDERKNLPTSSDSAPKVNSSISYSSYGTCLENTKDEPSAKNCCDCLSGDAELHKACRDATVGYDFSKNTVFKTFEIPSKLGRDGNYSTFTVSGNQQQCKQACESATSGLMCGDYQYCRTACNNLAK
ncbi:MAG: hypothetical protein WCO21_03490 [bacterium]